MRWRHAIIPIAAAVSLVAVSLAGAAANKEADSIWIIKADGKTVRSGAEMTYGETFKAGYTSRAREPFAFAQCWANDTTKLGTPNQGTYASGDVIWSGYRSLTGFTGDTFGLSDPIRGLWLGGGASCKLSLVTFSGSRQNTLSTIDFTVTG